MPHYVYRIRDASGAVRSGRIEARSQQEARARLLVQGGALEYLGPATAPTKVGSGPTEPAAAAPPPPVAPPDVANTLRLGRWLRRAVFVLPLLTLALWSAFQRDIYVQGRLRVPGGAQIDDVTYAFFVDGSGRLFPKELKYEQDGRFSLRLRKFSLWRPREVTGRVRLPRYEQLYIRGVPIVNGRADLGVIHLRRAAEPRR